MQTFKVGNCDDFTFKQKNHKEVNFEIITKSIKSS